MCGPVRFLPDAGIELDGRVSKKTTSISLPSGSQSFSSEYTYDPLGDVATLEYPTGDWPHESAPARTVSYNRRLTSHRLLEALEYARKGVELTQAGLLARWEEKQEEERERELARYRDGWRCYPVCGRWLSARSAFFQTGRGGRTRGAAPTRLQAYFVAG